MKVLIFSVFINLLFCYSIFDVHYMTLDLSAIKKCNKTLKASSNRVVLILTDGLSAQLLYNVTAQNWTKPSYLRKVIEGEGTWGISEAHIPSISKPALYAITSGNDFYSWKAQWTHTKMAKVKVDLVFNHADEVFFSGDPEVVRFFEPETTKRWHLKVWDSQFEETLFSEYTKLNEFAFNGILDFLADKKLTTVLHKKKTIFVIYLGGSDTCGHFSLPFSEKCSDVVKNMDSDIEIIDGAFKTFYGDNKTTFILTSDHGMSQAGYHGTGEEMQIKTPIMAWGSGVKRGGGMKHLKKTIPDVWKAENLSFVDIRQIDIASLISVFLGNPAPTHSCGLLPVEMVDLDDETIIDSLYCAEKQIWNMIVEQSKHIGDDELVENYMNSGINLTETRLKFNQSVAENIKSETVRLVNILHKIYRRQLSHFRNYFKKEIMWMVSFIYIGWGLLLLERCLIAIKVGMEEASSSGVSSKNILQEIIGFFGESCRGLMLVVNLLFLLSAIGFILIGNRVNWPLPFNIYAVLIIIVWWLVFKHIYAFRDLSLSKSVNAHNAIWAAITSICTIAVIIGVNVPYVRQVGFLFISIALCYLTREKAEVVIHTSWFVTSSFLVFFMNSPVVNLPPDTSLMQLGGIAWVFLACMHLYYHKKLNRDYVVTIALLLILIASQWNVTSIYGLENEDQYVDKVLHVSWSWMILYSVPFFVFNSVDGFTRFLHICYGLGSTFILLSVRHEAAGLAAFCANLLTWFCLEIRKSSKSLETAAEENKKGLFSDDFRRAFMLLAYTWIGYYAIGNINDPLSYNIYWTNCFLLSFKQLEITLFIIYKILIPLVVLCVAFYTMYIHLGLDVRSTLKWYLFLNNFAAFYFFHCTKSEGYGYTKIGRSFFHHVFSAIVPVIIVLLYPFMNTLLKFSLSGCFVAFYKIAKEVTLTKLKINKS